MTGFAASTLLAWAIEVAIGWPPWLYRRVRHPVVWIGALVSRLDRSCNDPAFSAAGRRLLGAASTVLVVVACAAIAALLSSLLPDTPGGVALEALAASSLIASRSLDEHVRAVGVPLAAGDIEGARRAVALIVGRDPDSLDRAGVARAALESLAENASDGVVAPLFWFVLLGLPGIAAYKAINTLDSMIGHLSERHREFGRFAARLDDVVNLAPARLTALLMVVAGARRLSIRSSGGSRRDLRDDLRDGLRDDFRDAVRDARAHRSPNAGWPESAMARVLGVRLSGPRGYGGMLSSEPWLNATARDPDGRDVLAGLALYRRALMLGALLPGALVLAHLAAAA